MPSETPLADTSPATNSPVLTVAELSGALKRTVEQAFAYVRVRGEISGCKYHGSGHVYLSLKDADAVIDAVAWRGTAQRLSIPPLDGMEVIVTGRLTTFPGRSKYQLVIEQMELAGEGALLKLLEDRKRKLAAEGLFAEERKRKLPYLPGVIGVITSPTGAVIRDILHRLAERFPRHVLVWPVAVQGEGAADQVARAIAGFNAIQPGGPISRPDLLIVARGGGSLEDLMAFNEEIVVRAAAASAIPLISAVGHETDTTLIDFASDRRAPTPTAAAEMAVPVRLDLLAETRSLGNRLDAGATRLLGERRLRLEGLARGLPDPMSLMENAAQRLDDRAERLKLAIDGAIKERLARVSQAAAKIRDPRVQLAEAERQLDRIYVRLHPAFDRHVERSGDRVKIPYQRLRPAADRSLERPTERVARLAQVLESLSPFKVLERGYAVVENEAGHPVGAADIAPGMALNLRFQDASVAARAEGGAKSPDAKRERKKPEPAKDRQPTLF